MLTPTIIGLIVIVIAVVVIGGAWVSIYNALIRQRQYVKEAWAQIDVQLQRRNDLIPNLVETVKGYATHERETLSEVIEKRNQVMQAPSDDPQAVMEASNQLTNTLRQLFALAESYPDLKANTNFMALQTELSETENKISYSRQLYNSAVAQYNIKRETFPNNLIAGIHGFNHIDTLAADEAARTVPEVKF